MKIVMRDGRVFQGTALQIVKAMQDIAFGVEDFTVPKYIEWVVANARKFEEVELDVRPMIRALEVLPAEGFDAVAVAAGAMRAAGSRMRTVVPRFGALSTSITPRTIFTIRDFGIEPPAAVRR